MAEQVKSFIRSAITPIASFVLFDVLNVNFFLGYFGLALETLEEDQEELQLESKRKIEAEEVRQRKKIKPSEDLANIEGEEIRDEEEERPGSRQKNLESQTRNQFHREFEDASQLFWPKEVHCSNRVV